MEVGALFAGCKCLNEILGIPMYTVCMLRSIAASCRAAAASHPVRQSSMSAAFNAGARCNVLTNNM